MPNPIEEKICSSCEVKKQREDFGKNPKTKDAHTGICKSCTAKYKKEYDKINEERKKIWSREYYKKNKEKINKYNNEYREEYKSEIATQAKKYYKKNRSRIYKYIKERRKNNISVRILGNLRTRLNQALKGKCKTATTISLIGCSVKELKEHLGKKFSEKMTWVNYGNYWEIDHILPCSSFNLVKKEEQIKCFHFSNLQPLTCSENRSKRDKIL